MSIDPYHETPRQDIVCVNRRLADRCYCGLCYDMGTALAIGAMGMGKGQDQMYIA